MRRPLAALLGAAAVALAPACHGREAPDDAFRAFTAAVIAHRADDAWSRLTKESQEAMTAAAAKVAALSPKGSVPTDPKQLLFGEDVGLAQPVDEIKVEDEKGAAATLEVVTGPSHHEVHMVREDGRWKLDLTDGLKL